jgi:sterol desaturase/sphingolipid hydroxylase (fatty acid hydroxylase superfamily)
MANTPTHHTPPGVTTDWASRTDQLRASPPMFRSALLDRLTRVHPAVVPAIYVPAIVVLAVLALRHLAVPSVLLAALGGYAFWTLCEYWIHRAIFHFEPEAGIGARLHWMVHGVHHDHPNDPLRLVMPPAVSAPLATGFLALFVAVVGTPAAWGVGAGFLGGYLFYDMVHYALHHHSPTTRLGRHFRELHMRHHFEDDERGFGISAPWWDLVFGTYARRVKGDRPAHSSQR